MTSNVITAKNHTKLAEEIQIGLTEVERQGVVDALTEILSDQHVLYIKLRNFHWNLIGPRFHSLHEFFEKQYHTLEQAIDDTAERIRMLGGVAPGSMGSFLERAGLDEAPDQLIHGDDALRSLIADHEICIRALRDHIKSVEEDYHDTGTADFLTSLIRQHEMDAWMLRSFLEQPAKG
jgi:starvation-inducible DNA-binding protein